MLNHVLDFALWPNVAALSGAAAGGAFSPSSLSPNAWFEAGTADMYTNSGTTHVAADGDAVAQWNDKSGNGRNLTDVYSTGVTSHPTYQSGAGKPYALCDGTNDYLETASASFTDGTGQHWIAISCMFPTNTGMGASLTGANIIAWIRDNAGQAGGASWNTAAAVTDNNGSAMTSSTPCVLIFTVTSTASNIYLDNVGNSVALTGTRESNAAQLAIASNNGTASFANVRIYGLVQGSGVLSSTDRASLQTYMAALHP